MPRVVAALAAAACLLLGAHAAECHGKPGPNPSPNLNPINTVAPTLVRTAPNGKAFQAGTPGNEFWVIHVYGSAYEMGFAHGTLMRDEVQGLINDVWTYFEQQVEEYLAGIPNWLEEDIANFGLDLALDMTAQLTQNFTGQYFFDELRGIADATGADYQKLLRIHMIGELTKGDCSMYGAWGAATASTGKTFQLRALDWDIDGPFKNYPAVVVYHPVGADLGHAFANVGFVGWIGALTGQSSAHMAISEIGVAFPDASFGQESREGVPFTFLLRDILQFDNSYKDTIKRITTANRTCDLILGAGDGNAQTFRAFEYSYSTATVISDTNLIPVNNTWHPKIPNVVYFGMDWLCPSYNQAMATQIRKYYGNITAENTIEGILPIVQTGDVHAAVYDLTDQFMFVSFAARSNGTGPINAYDRQFTKLDLNALFAEPAPSA